MSRIELYEWIRAESVRRRIRSVSLPRYRSELKPAALARGDDLAACIDGIGGQDRDHQLAMRHVLKMEGKLVPLLDCDTTAVCAMRSRRPPIGSKCLQGKTCTTGAGGMIAQRRRKYSPIMVLVAAQPAAVARNRLSGQPPTARGRALEP